MASKKNGKEKEEKTEAERQEMTKPTNVSGCPKNLKPLYIRGSLICSGEHRRVPKVCKYYNTRTGECDKEAF